jgi:peptidoglycan/LPS O-acetylase OafA/YrhL
MTRGLERLKAWRDRGSLGAALDPKRNSLNFLRLVFALFVVIGHAANLGGYKWQIYIGHTPIADVAVDGFFAISGYLIAGSAMRSNTIRFLWQRVLRIFPGFWVCLLVVAFGFGIVGWLHDHAGLSGYFGGSRGALSYIWQNFALRMTHFDINATPAHVPYPNSWDGSLWTLEWEFLCYLLVGGLALIGVLRRQLLVLVLFVASWALEAAQYQLKPNLSQAALSHGLDLLRFAPIFLAGSLIYVYRDKIPDSTALFTALLVLFAIGSFAHDQGNLAGPLLAYLCIWLGAHLPMARVGARNDLSYGIYIYAFPVTQLLAIWGVNRWGDVSYLVLIVAATLVLAGLSWKLVESPALRAKKWSPGSRQARTEPVPPAAMGN